MDILLKSIKKKSFKCDTCNGNFGRKDDLNKHIAAVHEVEKSFKCDTCNANFARKDNLKSNLILLMLNLYKNLIRTNILLQFMIERSHSNVKFVMLPILIELA